MHFLSQYATDDILEQARTVAQGRYALARKHNRSQPYGDPGNDKRIYIDAWSCLAEALAAEWLQVPWHNELLDSLADKPPDIGNCTEVRWTKYPSGHLIVHAEDNDDWFVILVTGEHPRMFASGWTVTMLGKQDCYRGHPLARSPLDYWVPPSDLFHTEFLETSRAVL